jgi:hypothetical protein
VPLVGKPIQPREIAGYCHKQGWRDKDLILAVATCLSESGGYPLAYHDNIDSTGKTTSRDVGLFQINIPASEIGSLTEKALYDIANNVDRAWKLYTQRGFEPWYGYTNGYATSTDWWRFSNSSKQWVPAGRYLQKAIRGVANYWGQEMKVQPIPLLYFDDKLIPPHPVS